MKALKDSGYIPKTSIRLVLGLNEETGMECMKIYNKYEKVPKASFTADADFPVIHAEKGISRFEFIFDLNKIQASKPFINQLIRIKAGVAANVIPDCCNVI